MYLGDIYTVSVNLAGLPAVSLPCGVSSDRLPIGLQLIGDCFQEKKLIRAAYTYEQARGKFPLSPAWEGRNAKTADGTVNAGTDGKGGMRKWQNNMKQ